MPQLSTSQTLENTDSTPGPETSQPMAHTNTEWHQEHLRSSGIDQVAFMHIGKTGGVSITRELMNKFDYRESIEIAPVMFHELEALQLDKKKLVVGHFSYDQLEYLSSNRFLFSMLRDPVDRVLSTYYFARSYPGVINETNRPIIDGAKQHSLLEFINLEHPDIQMAVRNQQTYAFASEWTADRTDHEDSILDLALLHLENFDFVGLFEFYNSSMQYLSFRCGFAPWPSRNIINKTTARKRVEEIPSEIVEKIRSLNRLDLELYRVCRSTFEEKNCAAFEPQVQGQCERLRGKYSVLNTGPFSHSFGSAMDGMGWHQRENNMGQHFRWMGPDTDATIWLPIDRTEERIVCFHFTDSTSANLVKELRLFSGDTECARTKFSSPEDDDLAIRSSVEWILPKGPRANHTDSGMLHLRTQTVIPLPKPIGPDPAERYGSVAVHRIDVI